MQTFTSTFPNGVVTALFSLFKKEPATIWEVVAGFFFPHDPNTITVISRANIFG